MKKEVLIIVDMINGFINEGALADHRINKITPNIIKLIEQCIKSKTPIIAFADSHKENCKEFETYPVHCLEGSHESELIPELKKFEKFFTIIPKNSTNGFKTATFQKIAKKIVFDKATIVGCCTDICVEDFVSTYAKFNLVTKRPTQLNVPSNCVFTFNSPTHNAEESHNNSLSRMSALGVNTNSINFMENKDEQN